MEPERNVIPMPIPDNAKKDQRSAGDDATGGSVDKIRDILFGTQMRDYDRRFARLEDRLIKESNELRDETRQRFDSLESFIKSEFSALSDRLKAENKQRDEMGADISTRLQDTAKSLERKLAELDELTAQNQSALRQQMLDQATSMNEEFRRKYEEISNTIKREADELRHDKTDRAALADLFTELALRLNHDFKLPGA